MDGILAIVLFLLGLAIIFGIFRDFFRQHISEILTAIGGIGMGLADIKSDSADIFFDHYSWKDAWPILFCISAFFLMLSITLTYRRSAKRLSLESLRETNHKLIKKIERIKNEYLRHCSDSIKNIFPEFLSTQDSRVTIYKHQAVNEFDQHFTLLGRYSRVPDYNKARDYPYPLEGFMAYGWNAGEFEIQGVPVWSGKGKKWKKFMKENCLISDHRLEKIKMKSTSFYIITLDDPTTSEDPDGLIVFERTEGKTIDTQALKLILKDREKEIVALLRNMKSLTSKFDSSSD
jgi:uncharacterized protein (UPF0335 family)